jgi:hypothetical protein
MNSQITVRLSDDELDRLETVHAMLHNQEKYTQSRASVLRRLIAIACDVMLESRQPVQA